MAERPNDLARFAGLGIQFAITLVLLGGLGWWLDSAWGTQPWLLVVGVLAGGVLAFISLVRAVPRARGTNTRPPTDFPSA